MKYRKKLLQVNYEKQSTSYSCAAKCLQLVLNYHQPETFPLGEKLELNILKESKLKGHNEATHPGLVLFSLKKGFNVEYITKYSDLYQYPSVEHPGYTMPEDEFNGKIEVDKEYFKKALEKGANNQIIENIEAADFKKYIDQNLPIIAMTDKRGMLHDVVIRGYKNNMFKIVDPVKGYRSIYSNKLESLVNTRYGNSLIVVKP